MRTAGVGGVNGLGFLLTVVAFSAIALGAVSAVTASVVYDHRAR